MKRITEKQIVESIKNQKLNLGELQNLGMNIQRTMGQHEGYLQALKDLLGEDKANELNDEATLFVNKLLKSRGDK